MDTDHLQVRRTRPSDWPAIETLNQKARRTVSWLWCWGKHLTDDLFVVIEHEGTVMGSLFAWYDESPIAWVQQAALDDTLDADTWFNLALPPVLDRLRRREIRGLAWMDSESWAGPHRAVHGFRRLTDVITLAKLDRALPDVEDVEVHLRQASDTDIPAVVAVDRTALSPHWWYSESTMRQRAAVSFHFSVAEVAGAVVGYAEGELHPPVAHLNRIAVHPDHQGRGIGASLLRDALRTFWRRGAERVTLNTQNDNRRSQRLYRRFGFESTGDSTTAWEMKL